MYKPMPYPCNSKIKFLATTQKNFVSGKTKNVKNGW